MRHKGSWKDGRRSPVCVSLPSHGSWGEARGHYLQTWSRNMGGWGEVFLPLPRGQAGLLFATPGLLSPACSLFRSGWTWGGGAARVLLLGSLSSLAAGRGAGPAAPAAGMGTTAVVGAVGTASPCCTVGSPSSATGGWRWACRSSWGARSAGSQRLLLSSTCFAACGQFGHCSWEEPLSFS